MQSNNTAAANAAILSALRNLEGPIHGLSMMTTILGDMLDDDLIEIDMETGDKRCSPATGRNLKVILTKGQIDRLSFAWNDVIIRAVGLQRAYLAALEGEEVSA